MVSKYKSKRGQRNYKFINGKIIILQSYVCEKEHCIGVYMRGKGIGHPTSKVVANRLSAKASGSPLVSVREIWLRLIHNRVTHDRSRPQVPRQIKYQRQMLTPLYIVCQGRETHR